MYDEIELETIDKENKLLMITTYDTTLQRNITSYRVKFSVFAKAHINELAGHPGRDRTLATVKKSTSFIHKCTGSQTH
jgi:hypothetical protein